MKFNLMAVALLGVAAALLALPANAQTWSKSNINSNGNFNVRVGVYNSGTTVQDGKLFDVSAPAYLVVSSSAAGFQAIVTPVLADGTPGGAPSQTISVNTVTPTIVSFSAPVPFSALRVSPLSVLSGVNTMTSKIIQSK